MVFCKFMRKIIFIFFFISFFSNICFGATFNWKKAAVTDDDTSEWFYDPKTVFKVGDYTYYWILSNYLKDIEDDIYSVIGLHMVNCENYESRWISYTGYNRPMGKGTAVEDYIIPAIDVKYFEWTYFDPRNTTYGTLLKKVCSQRTN